MGRSISCPKTGRSSGDVRNGSPATTRDIADRVAEVHGGLADEHRTGRYEELVYGKKIDPAQFGIAHPDFVGSDGGLPVKLADGTRLAVAMSGFTGETDCSVIRQTVARVPGMLMAE